MISFAIKGIKYMYFKNIKLSKTVILFVIIFHNMTFSCMFNKIYAVLVSTKNFIHSPLTKITAFLSLLVFHICGILAHFAMQMCPDYTN